MKKLFICLIVFFVVTTCNAQLNTKTRLIRFAPVSTASDTSASAANNGRLWFDFSSQKLRGVKNGAKYSVGTGGTTSFNVTFSSGQDTYFGSNVWTINEFSEVRFESTSPDFGIGYFSIVINDNLTGGNVNFSVGTSGYQMQYFDGINPAIILRVGPDGVTITNLPTSSAGLPSGALWRDAGAGNVIKMVP